MYPLKGLHTKLITCEHAPLVLAEGWQLGGTRDIWEKTELCDTEARAGKTVTIIPLLVSSLEHSTDGHNCAFVELFPCMANSEAALPW